MFFSKKSVLERIVASKDRGVLHRIDDNRALLELLQRAAPDLLREHPRIGTQLRAQDEFLEALARACPGISVPANVSRIFPRPWPIQAPQTWVGGVVKGGHAEASTAAAPLRRVR